MAIDEYSPATGRILREGGSVVNRADLQLLHGEPGSPGFYEGREFRVTQKIRLETGQEIVFKNILNVDVLIQRFAFDITNGNFEVHVWVSDNVTEVGALTTPVAFAPKNASSEFKLFNGQRYQSQMQIFSSGAVTTGSVITVTDPNAFVDYLELKTANATAQASGVSGGSSSFRYSPSPVTFYTQITNLGNGACRGVINNEWEERPVESQVLFV